MKYFGTDGFRGKVNQGLTADHAFKVGEAFGAYVYKHFTNPKVYIGKDTRLSGSMLEFALASGLSSQGVECHLLGVCSTPMVSYLTQSSSEFAGAIMISASHNPYTDNGIKIFEHSGDKLKAEVEEEIEQYLDGKVELKSIDGALIGRIIQDDAGLVRYLEHLKCSFKMDLSGYKIVLDCANGSSVMTAQKAFESFNAQPIMMHHQPDGLNINRECGSTHPKSLQDKVIEENADLGFAFDGDADRVIVVNRLGQELNGDYILYIIAKYLKAKERLDNNVVIGTVMANLGLIKAFEQDSIDFKATQVGDKYVAMSLEEEKAILGGEQSGHIILKRLGNTGDGVLVALKIMSVLFDSQRSLEELTQGLTIYPQRLINTKVKDKHQVLKNQEILKYIENIETEIHGEGRILVRPSGTEPMVRVMVEAKTQERCDHLCQLIVDYILSKEV